MEGQFPLDARVINAPKIGIPARLISAPAASWRDFGGVIAGTMAEMVEETTSGGLSDLPATPFQ